MLPEESFLHQNTEFLHLSPRLQYISRGFPGKADVMAKQYQWYRCPHKWGLCIQVRSSVRDFKGSIGAMLSKPNEQTVKKLPRLWTRMSELQYTFPCQRPKRISSGQHIQSLNGQRGKSQTISCSSWNIGTTTMKVEWTSCSTQGICHKHFTAQVPSTFFNWALDAHRWKLTSAEHSVLKGPELLKVI